MTYIKRALEMMKERGNKNATWIIPIEDDSEAIGTSTITAYIQTGTIPEKGINGAMPRDLIEYLICIFEVLNETHRCRENSITITKLQEALMWQDERTADRKRRDVEGRMKD